MWLWLGRPLVRQLGKIMTLKDAVYRYFDGEVDAIQLIRDLSGMFNPDHAVTLLSLICTITRHEQGDIDTETFKKVWFKDEGTEEREEVECSS